MFFFIAPATTDIYTLSLHDALPIYSDIARRGSRADCRDSSADSLAIRAESDRRRSEEHTSELQSHHDLVCRLLLEKKKVQNITRIVQDAAALLEQKPVPEPREPLPF